MFIMLIGEIVKQSGLSKDGIRYYEQLGLIHSSPKPAGSRVYRDYHPDTLQRLGLIECGKNAGFTLKEIQPLLSLFLCGEMEKSKKNEILRAKMAELELREKAIQEMKAFILSRL